MRSLDGLPGAIGFDLTSEHAHEKYEITVLVPDASCFPLPLERVPDRFRVLYVLDGDRLFPTVYSVVDGGLWRSYDTDKPLEPLIIVGIGYGRGLEYAMTRRFLDLSPPGTPMSPAVQQLIGDVEQGGAVNFLRFIEDELDPKIRASFPVADAPSGLFGWSYGGLFAAFALFSRATTFDSYLIASPGNVFPEQLLLELEQRCFEAGTELEARVHITCGALERTSALEFLRHVPIAYDRLVERLRSRDYEGLTLTAHEYEGESHTSCVLRTLLDGLAIVYPGSSLAVLPD